MIYPQTLYNFGKVCKDSQTAGNVLRALCRQQVPLTPSEQVMLDMIQNDNEWMNERIDDQRERWKERQRKARLSRPVTQCHGDKADVTQCHGDKADVTQCHGDNGDTPDVTIPTSLPPSPPTSLQESTNRSVPVNARTRTHTRENGTERNENGTADTIIGGGGLDEARRLVRQFKAALDADQSAFFDPEHDAVTICAALTGDYRSLNRWRQLVKAKGEDAVREEAFAFWREIRAGEDVANRGATLNRRLGDLADAKKDN